MPGFAVVAAFLTLPDRCAGDDTRGRADGQYGQLIIKWCERFDDDAGNTAFTRRTAADLRFMPSGVDGIARAYDGLTVPGRAHNRLDHTRVANRFGPCTQFLKRPGEAVGCGRQAELLVGDDTQTFTVHADRCDTGAWHDLHALRGNGVKFRCGDRLDFGNNDVRLDFSE